MCINQADIEERSKQVALMSFIYTRAKMVIAWLGTKEYRTQLDPFRSMSMDWKSGQTRLLAANVAKDGRFNSSLEPDQGTLARIANSSYWTRIWIIQEVCLPRILVFIYGSKLWSYENLKDCEVMNTMRSGLAPLGPLAQHVDSNAFGAMFRLLDAKARLSDGMKLESLIELFARQLCSDLKDRVYSLLSLANDVRPISGSRKLDSSAKKDSSSSHHYQRECSDKPQKGAGTFRVDYSKSYYDIWIDVINFVSSRTANIRGRVDYSTWNTSAQKVGEDSFWRYERGISIVRTAGIVQDAFGTKVEEELANDELPKESARPTSRPSTRVKLTS